MIALETLVFALVALGGVGVVFTRDPLRQAFAIAFYGLTLVVMFVVFQAPDVALSQIAVGAVALPLMIVLTVAKVRKGDEE